MIHTSTDCWRLFGFSALLKDTMGLIIGTKATSAQPFTEPSSTGVEQWFPFIPQDISYAIIHLFAAYSIVLTKFHS